MANCECRGAQGPVHAWSLRLLDGWQLRHCPAEVADVPTRERRLLSLLALRGERPRAQIAPLLWPDSPEGRAQGNLRAAVWHIQHRHHGVLAEDHGVLGLAPGVHVDVHELRSAAEHLAAGPDHVRERELLLRVLDHEDLLPGWSEHWVDGERALLHQFRLRALERLVDVLLRESDPEGALRVAMRAAAIDPYRESAQRCVIRVHLAEGNHAEALRVYERFGARLREDLGVTVSPQLHRLVEPLLLRSPAGGLPVAPTSGVRGRS